MPHIPSDIKCDLILVNNRFRNGGNDKSYATTQREESSQHYKGSHPKTPQPSKHHNINDELCYINVSGKQYITTFECLEKYPQTLLGSKEREKYWIPELKSYYFNRNRECFELILTFYQTGRDWKFSGNIDMELYQEEREFFGLNRIADSDDLNSNPDTMLVIEDPSSNSAMMCYRHVWLPKRKRVHRFLMDPRSSIYATAWHVMDILFICLSITLLVLETDPRLTKYFTDKNEEAYYYLYYTNVFVIAFFSTDLLVRFITWPNTFSFFPNMFNILDILSILPFYVSVIADSIDDHNVGADDGSHKTYVVLRVCRIFRIVRVFKFIRHSQDLIMIIKVVAHAKRELSLLVLLLGIFSMSFGSLMYYVEHSANPDQFSSIMQGCWWAIVTITTIGYGDISPVTWQGKIVGSVVLTLGIVFLALPMTIIVGKFSAVYETEKTNTSFK